MSDQEAKDANDRYIREVLGGIILEYKVNHGFFPDAFQLAVKSSGKVLTYCGDSKGRS